MKIARIKISNFRGIKSAELLLPDHVVFVGDNNTGKSTVLEAVDLVLGPERLNRPSPIDEHDFYAGEYIGTDESPISISVEVVVIDLSDDQILHFGNHIEWWNTETKTLLQEPPPEETDKPEVIHALRLGFEGKYDSDEDNFVCETFFMSPQGENGAKDPFRTRDKRLCGFLFLRTLRTGSRALSLERGSLLDIILRLQELRLNMWEGILGELRELAVAENEELGISAILEEVQNSVRKFVPSEWAENPRIRVSDLTREHLRKTLTVFMGTGENTSAGKEYAAPFSHQGTGTINTLVLALLTMIADLKQNVIFAMEEPEIAIPPHTQRRIVDSVRNMAAQSIFTSHSPYVLDEFAPESLVILKREGGILEGMPATLPPAVKSKAYREQLRTRFCECLLARRILIVEGRTEYDAVSTAARRLHELDPDRFKTLESLGLAVINAETDSQIAPLGSYFRTLGKKVYAISDQQEPAASAAISAAVDTAFESPEASFEKLLLNHTDEAALRRFGKDAVDDGRWPSHLAAETPYDGMDIAALKAALGKFLKNNKGTSEAAFLVGMCSEAELPEFLVSTIEAIRIHCSPSVLVPEATDIEGAAPPTGAEVSPSADQNPGPYS
ncbi:AAA family ATPase [Acidithiobacillus ferrooxidans]|jgi:putative ATP-dependent endonuclease of OLD family|uniref:ATP-dependent nuclease n=1 Tax=Acidithiobacillus ferrooxidans TaxID=920 RepID=UPI001C06578B|nr:AAA family ATPase [Acidithiobacillus ferrooxidans]MBU2856698.1 AAA family ATPase [Acidithiobacillus ferrooxidans]MBU2860015.1 AAA family ATPase [Acidithiobacillus ferrooxidans]